MPYDILADCISGNILITALPPVRKRKRRIFWPDEPYNGAWEEESLWKAVITQAVVDACNNSPDPDFMFYKKLAIQWLTEGGEDFIDVCIRAGLEPERVRMLSKKALLHPSLWRAEAGLGWRYEEKKRWRKRRRKMRKQAKAAPAPPACIIVYPFN